MLGTEARSIIRMDWSLPDSSPTDDIPDCWHDAKSTITGVAPRARTLNDANVIYNRRVKYDARAGKDFELACENMVSRRKLEELFTSIPSTTKPTFIMTFSPDGQKVASTHGDHRIYICDLNSGKLLDTLEGHPKTPWCLAWHPSNKDILASGCLAGEVKVWDLKSRACETFTSYNNSIITSLDFHPRERILVIATANDLLFWDWSESEPFAKTSTMHDKEKVKYVMFDSSGTKLITGISNPPRYAGYSNESLQNRIIDNYMAQGNMDQVSSDNMTSNSETTNRPGTSNRNPQSNNNPATNTTTHNHRPTQQARRARVCVPGNHNNNNGRPAGSSSNDSHRDINSMNTWTLSQVATYYQRLEELEASMRLTSFSPIVNTVRTESNQNTEPQVVSIESNTASATSNNAQNSTQANSTDPVNSDPSNAMPNDSETSQGLASDSLVVSFDEFLTRLNLQPLLLDRQGVDINRLMQQYTNEAANQIHYILQTDSMQLVNQNFIRISKLLDSVRLYRQIVEQIRSRNNGPEQDHFQANQILTAQCSSPTASRQTSNLPIVFRNFPSRQGSNETESPPNLRSIDPIMAIQFRRSARNVPLATICKIDLLVARSFCITRSQRLIESALASSYRAPSEQSSSEHNQRSVATSTADLDSQMATSTPIQQEERAAGSSRSPRLQVSQSIATFHPLLHQLHQVLTAITHDPLTTSNVYPHVISLRNLVDEILHTLTSMMIESDRARLYNLIHGIARNLTGRGWDTPLGANLSEIRLDVIHTLFTIDLTLHVARQVQLAQMQSLITLTRINNSRQNFDSSNAANPEVSVGNRSDTASADQLSRDAPAAGPSSKEGAKSPARKRKAEAPQQSSTPSGKRIRSQVESILSKEDKSTSTTSMPSMTDEFVAPAQQAVTRQSAAAMDTTPNLPSASSVNQRVQSQTMQTIEQSLQRFLATASNSPSQSQIIVRIYQRPNGQTSSHADQAIDTGNDVSISPLEYRRRALSQDNMLMHQSNQVGHIVAPTNDNTLPQMHSVDQNQSSLHHRITARLHVPIQLHQDNATPPAAAIGQANAMPEGWPRLPYLQIYQSRGAGQHLWFNQWTIPLSMTQVTYRLQCWDFSLAVIPNIKDSQSNIVTSKCRIHNDSSIDISLDGTLLACLVPREESTFVTSFDFRVFSLKTKDFGLCYFKVAQDSTATSVSLSPSGTYAIVGLARSRFLSSEATEDDITIAKIFNLTKDDANSFVRDIKIKRGDSISSLNAIRWMSRGIVYNVGPQHHQRIYPATWMRNRVVS